MNSTFNMPFWINPCGIEETDSISYSMTQLKMSAEKNILSALKSAEELKEFLKDAYPSIDMDSLADYPLFNFLKNIKSDIPSNEALDPRHAYKWIQGYSVRLEQIIYDVQKDYKYIRRFKDSAKYHNLQDVKKSETLDLRHAYKWIQGYAVVLEQMIYDSEKDYKYIKLFKDPAKYHNLLQDMKTSMIQVLCSLYLIIYSLKCEKFEDITRDIMPRELKQNLLSVKMIRDTTVAKRYVNLLHFLKAKL